ncbi:MAG: SDR family oxidoreductase [Bacteroidetes bacterium]|nr:SDR family oxidoreductase [Bacteroidota bacterium]MBS1974408.1 SDR family oxidoreductase [Bacteroidota bacterium]
MSFFSGKVVVITGGSDGIGRALIDALIPQGAKIATCARNYDKLYSLQLQYPNVLLHTMSCDVSVETECKRFIDSVIEEFGHIDILINNAGISMRSLFSDVQVEVMKKVMDVNFFGAVYCTKYALPSIIENKGTVVGISSTAGYRGLPGRSGYSASKFALQGWLEALRSEMTGSGVNIMWVSPGFTASNIRNAALNEKGEMQGESPLDESKLMNADECAQHIIRAIEKRKRTLVLTSSGRLTIFMNKFFPAWSDRLVYNHFFKDKKLIK